MPSASELPGDSARAPSSVAAIVVWAFWALFTLTACLYVFRYSHNVPSWDEWDMVPTVTRNEPVTWHWLWSQHNEHRIPVPRLVMLAVDRTFLDFRACMYLSVLLVAGTTAWLMRIIAKRRGRTEWTDVFLPVVALNLGQGLNFIWGWQIEFFLSTVFLLAMLGIVARSRVIDRTVIVMTCGLLLLLAGSGAHGLVPIPAIVVWAFGIAWFSLRRKESASSDVTVDWRLAAVTGVLGAVLIAAYLHGFERVPHYPTSHGIRHSLITAMKAVTMSFGVGVRTAWPWSGMAMTGFIALTVGWLARIFWTNANERVRAWNFLGYLAAAGGLAAALGLGRNGFEPRYVTLLFPLLFGLYFVWSFFDDQKIARVARIVLAVASLAVLWSNTRFGVAYARSLSAGLTRFERDLSHGVPKSQLIARHAEFLHPLHQIIDDNLPMLRAAKIGRFSALRDDPPLKRVPIPAEQWQLSRASLEGTSVVHNGKALVTVHLAKPTLIAGVTMKFNYHNRFNRVPLIHFEWRTGTQPFESKDRYYRLNPTGDRQNWERYSYSRRNDPDSTFLVWMWQTVTEFRFAPDYTPGTFDIKELSILEPAGS